MKEKVKLLFDPEAYKGKKVLITGGMGFIGSNLAYRLVEFGADVLLVDSMIPEYGGNLFNINGLEKRLKVNFSDIRDKTSMDYLVKGQDYIFNLAGTLSHVDSMKDPFTDLEINCRSQLSLLESCRLYNRDTKILFAGTRGQYGRAEYLPVNEKHPLNPTDVNGINNLAGELYHILYCRVHGIRATSLRLTNTYGPRHQMKHPRQGIINWFIRSLIDGQEVKIYGDGKQVRDINYVDDVVGAMLIAMSSPKSDGEVYNIGGTPMNLVDLVKKMIDVHGKGKYKLVSYPQDAKVIEIGDYIADWSKFKVEFGWSPVTTLEIGLDNTFKYYKSNKSNYW